MWLPTDRRPEWRIEIQFVGNYLKLFLMLCICSPYSPSGAAFYGHCYRPCNILIFVRTLCQAEPVYSIVNIPAVTHLGVTDGSPNTEQLSSAESCCAVRCLTIGTVVVSGRFAQRKSVLVYLF